MTRKYNTRKVRKARLEQMRFCEVCGIPFVPSRRYPYVCVMCGSVNARRQNASKKGG